MTAHMWQRGRTCRLIFVPTRLCPPALSSPLRNGSMKSSITVSFNSVLSVSYVSVKFSITHSVLNMFYSQRHTVDSGLLRTHSLHCKSGHMHFHVSFLCSGSALICTRLYSITTSCLLSQHKVTICQRVYPCVMR